MHHKIEILVRARPLSPKEAQSQEEQLPLCPSLSIPSNLRHKHHTFLETLKHFPYFFPPETSTQVMFSSQRIQNLLNGFLQGNNGSILLYGQTGAGKTYTMLGSTKTSPLTTKELNTSSLSNPDLINSNKDLLITSLIDLNTSSISNKDITSNNSKGLLYLSIEFLLLLKPPSLQASYVEIYNERLFDLLSPELSEVKNLKEHVQKGFFIQGLTLQSIRNLQDLEKTLLLGEKNRHYAETSLNHHSSRSHTLFRVSYLGKEGDCFLDFVDLAGSERISEGINKKETKAINKSLFFLTNVISQMAKGKGHVAYRNSILTKLLRYFIHISFY